jgi:hypothetical protein
MRRIPRKLLTPLACALLLAAVSASAQIYRYYSPGSVWTVTTIRVKPGMDQKYFQYLDGEFKKESDGQVKAGFMKSYKVLRTLDDDSSWNLIILREYKSLASLEADAEKSDELSRQLAGDDQRQMQGYEDRSSYREVLGTKTARELVLK